MNGHDRMLSLIRHVYSAAADATRWPSALEQLADECQGSVAGYLTRTTNSVVRSATLVRIDPQLVEASLGYFATRNPWRPFDQPSFAPGSIIPVEQMVPVAELRRTEYYDGLLRPAQVLHAFGACVLRRGNQGVTFTALRSGAKGPFQPRELTRIRVLLPHLQRAIQINSRLSQLDRTRAALSDALDRLAHGVIVINRQGTVTFANGVARSIVSQKDGLTIQADGLAAVSHADRLKLQSLIEQAVRTSAGDGFGAGGAMTISRPSLKRPFHVLIAPLRLALEPHSPRGLATVFVSDPETAAEPAKRTLTEAYGLTAREAQLAMAFAASGSLKDAAQHLSISYETARWHLKRIYQKTGAHHQGALVRMLVEGTGRLRLDAAPGHHRAKALRCRTISSEPST